MLPGSFSPQKQPLPATKKPAMRRLVLVRVCLCKDQMSTKCGVVDATATASAMHFCPSSCCLSPYPPTAHHQPPHTQKAKQAMAATVSTSTNTHHGPSLVDDTLKRLKNLKNVQHVLILTENGVALRSTLSPVRKFHWKKGRSTCAGCMRGDGGCRLWRVDGGLTIPLHASCCEVIGDCEVCVRSLQDTSCVCLAFVDGF